MCYNNNKLLTANYWNKISHISKIKKLIEIIWVIVSRAFQAEFVRYKNVGFKDLGTSSFADDEWMYKPMLFLSS